MYLVKARKFHRIAAAEQKAIEGDVVMLDASRVASQEVLLVHWWAHSVYTVAPLQILQDALATTDQARTVAAVGDAVLGKSLSSSREVGVPTRLYALGGVQ